MTRTARRLTSVTFEALLAAFPLLVLFQLPVSFAGIWAAVAAGLVIERLVARWSVPVPVTRLLLLLAAAVTAYLWLLMTSGSSGLAALSQIIPGRAFSWPQYAGTLGAMILFHRGSRIAAASRDERIRTVWWGAALAVGSLILSAWLNPQQHPAAPLLTISLPLLMLLHLAEQPSSATPARLPARRSVLMTLLVAALTIPLGLIAALVADAEVLRTAAADALRLLLVPLALFGALAAQFINQYVAGPFIALFQMFAIRLRMTSMPAIESEAQQFAPLPDAVETASATLAADVLLGLVLLLPLLLAITLFIIVRRRQRRLDEPDESRHSLGVAGNLAQDLRELWQRLRRDRTPTGLRAALAALNSRQPTIRVRRALVEVLLLLEAQQLLRRPAESLTAFLTRAAQRFPTVADELARLTTCYLPARYADQARDEDARSAEDALRAVHQLLERERR